MSWVPNTAMVFAAGLGTRMRPLTDDLPKPLVPLAGRPLIDHALDRLAEAGVNQVIVNVHYLAEKVESYLTKRKAPKITISDERDELLDTGGGIIKAQSHFGDDSIVIHNSDTVWIDGVSDNLKRLFSAWDPEKMDTLMLLASTSACLGYSGTGDFNMDSDGRIVRRPEGRMAPFVFAGVSIAHPRLFQDAPSGAFSLNVLWDRAIKARRAYGIRLDGYWMHVGTPDALVEAEAAIAQGLLSDDA